MDLQALTGQAWTDSEALWEGLDRRRAMLNQHLPVRTMDNQAPLMAYPAAIHSQRPYQLAWEEQMLQPERVYRYLASGHWFRRTNAGGRFALGGYSYQTSWQWRQRTVEITVEAESAMLLCRIEGAMDAPVPLPIQGLSKADLMGEMSLFQRLPHFQLSLPWSPQEWRAIAYAELTAA